MRRRSRRLGSLVLAILMLGVVSGTVAAKSGNVYDQGSYDNPFTDTFCGFDVQGREWGRWQVLNATAATNGQFFTYSSSYNGHTTITNPANGKFITEDWSGVFREVNPRPEATNPNVIDYQTIDLGTYKVKSSNGRTLHAEIDFVLTTYVLDTLGDSQPGGVLLDRRELINTTDTSFDLCALATRVLS
jgi:hypothetical protein